MYDELDDEMRQMDEREADAPQLMEGVHLDDPISTLQLQKLVTVASDTTLKDAIAALSNEPALARELLLPDAVRRLVKP